MDICNAPSRLLLADRNLSCCVAYDKLHVFEKEHNTEIAYYTQTYHKMLAGAA
jgi:hypothetical protein